MEPAFTVDKNGAPRTGTETATKKRPLCWEWEWEEYVILLFLIILLNFIYAFC